MLAPRGAGSLALGEGAALTVGLSPGGVGLWDGPDAQPASVPTIAIKIRIFLMTLLILEALGALLLLVLIVWWTMFSGRKHGELLNDTADSQTDAPTPADKK